MYLNLSFNLLLDMTPDKEQPLKPGEKKKKRKKKPMDDFVFT